MINNSNTPSPRRRRAKRRAIAALHVAFVALFVAAGSLCALVSMVIEALVFAEQFKKPSAYGSVLPLVLALVVSLETAKTFLHYYCSSSAVARDQKESRNRLIYNPLRILLTLISLGAGVIFCCWQLESANYRDEAAKLAVQIQARQQAAVAAIDEEFKERLTSQSALDQREVEYWQNLFDAQRTVQRPDGTWIGDRAREIMPRLAAAKSYEEQHRTSILREKTAKLEETRTGFSKETKEATAALRLSNDSDSPVVGSVLALFYGRPDYPHRYYTTAVLVQGTTLGVAIEGIIMACFMILGGFERRRSLSGQLANEYESLEEIVQSFGDKMEDEVAASLRHRFAAFAGPNGQDLQQ